MSNEYKCCSYCDKFLKDCTHKFLFVHSKDDKYCCTKEPCMFKYLLETHSKMNAIVN